MSSTCICCTQELLAQAEAGVDAELNDIENQSGESDDEAERYVNGVRMGGHPSFSQLHCGLPTATMVTRKLRRINRVATWAQLRGTYV